jgi:predicted membrane channel-forming protein YqfA (hemolysin III family)
MCQVKLLHCQVSAASAYMWHEYALLPVDNTHTAGAAPKQDAIGCHESHLHLHVVKASALHDAAVLQERTQHNAGQ